MVRKGGWDSSSFSLFLSFIHSRISRETAERAVIIRQIVSIILSCCSQFCGLTNIYIRFPAIWFLQGVYLSECVTLHIQKIHYTICSSPLPSTKPPVNPLMCNAIRCLSKWNFAISAMIFSLPTLFFCALPWQNPIRSVKASPDEASKFCFDHQVYNIG